MNMTAIAKHLHVPRNDLGRDFVIGDLHGAYTKFERLMARIGFDDHKDRMFSVGDLIDRGKDSMRCLELTSLPWFYAVMGNHEHMALHSEYHQFYADMWMQNGGVWAAKLQVEELSAVRELVRVLPLTITIDNKIGISHAEAPFEHDNDGMIRDYDWNLRENPDNEEQLLWGRQQIKQVGITVKNIDKTYHGHTPKKDIVCTGNSYFIDTGAVREDRKLTCVELEY